MGIFVSAILVALALAALAYVAFFVVGSRTTKREPSEVVDKRVPILRYVVPEGQDPVVLVSALRQAGYEAASDLVEGVEVVAVLCPAGADRERPRVRAVIGEGSQTSVEGNEFDPGAVEFEDERAG